MKLADLNISNDGCGPYVVNIYGNDKNSFIIRNNALYFKDDVVFDSRIKSNYSIIIAIEDFSKRFPPITRSYSVNLVNCIPPSTTTTTTTTTTTATTSTTSTTSTSTTIGPNNCPNYTINPTIDFIDTGIDINAYTSLNITANGSINIGWPDYPNNNGPDGKTEAPTDSATGLTNAALLGRINGQYFKIGSQYSGNPQIYGRLFIGIYDSIRGDNSGQFNVNLCYGYSYATCQQACKSQGYDELLNDQAYPYNYNGITCPYFRQISSPSAIIITYYQGYVYPNSFLGTNQYCCCVTSQNITIIDEPPPTTTTTTTTSTTTTTTSTTSTTTTSTSTTTTSTTTTSTTTTSSTTSTTTTTSSTTTTTTTTTTRARNNYSSCSDLCGPCNVYKVVYDPNNLESSIGGGICDQCGCSGEGCSQLDFLINGVITTCYCCA